MYDFNELNKFEFRGCALLLYNYCYCVSLRYVLTLMVEVDSMRSVRSFNFEKAAASVLTTCVSIRWEEGCTNHATDRFIDYIVSLFNSILSH